MCVLLCTNSSVLELSLFPIQVAWLYRYLLYSIYGGKSSTGDQRAEDIVAVIKTMQEAEVEVRMHYVYPALAHYAQEGHIDGKRIVMLD